jgi:hypothetical protein
MLRYRVKPVVSFRRAVLVCTRDAITVGVGSRKLSECQRGGMRPLRSRFVCVGTRVWNYCWMTWKSPRDWSVAPVRLHLNVGDLTVTDEID